MMVLIIVDNVNEKKEYLANKRMVKPPTLFRPVIMVSMLLVQGECFDWSRPEKF